MEVSPEHIVGMAIRILHGTMTGALSIEATPALLERVEEAEGRTLQ